MPGSAARTIFVTLTTLGTHALRFGASGQVARSDNVSQAAVFTPAAARGNQDLLATNDPGELRDELHPAVA